MLNPRLAARYAKSLIDISVEQNQLEKVKEEVAFVLDVAEKSKEFKRLFKSPIVPGDKKLAVMKALGGDKFTPIMNGFIRLLVAKGRENVLPEIMTAFMEQYRKLNGIHRISITTAHPMSEEMRKGLLQKLHADAGIDKVELTEIVREEIIGGYIVEYDNKLVDASIQRDLRDIKRQFYSNDYIYKIR
jgi:F-type H+-transporting ATPase subunit delta